MSIHMFFDTTDAGPDPSARRRRIRAGVAEIPFILYFDMNCLLHQYHIIVKDSLSMIDSFLKEFAAMCAEFKMDSKFTGYVGSMAKLIHFWRERVAQFIDAWELVHTEMKQDGRLPREHCDDGIAYRTCGPEPNN
jgi:hypothetical protein